VLGVWLLGRGRLPVALIALAAGFFVPTFFIFIFTAGLFRDTFFFANFLGVGLFLASFFLDLFFAVALRTAVLFDFVCFFLGFFLAGINAVYH